MNIIKVRDKRKLHVMLIRIDQTPNAWIFKFGEPYHKFIQTMILPKYADWQLANEMWETVYEKFSEKARENEWLGR